jgi:hypothetical protein
LPSSARHSSSCPRRRHPVPRRAVPPPRLAKASTLGILLILGGAAINLRTLNDITSVVLAGVLHLLASPPASNMLSRAAYLAGGLRGEVIDEHPAVGGVSRD